MAIVPDIIAAAKSLPNVTGQLYDDAVAPAAKQVGKLVEGLAKCVRLIAFPVQFGASLQDRLDRYLAEATAQVKPENLVLPAESILLPILEKLKFQEECNLISKLYVNLLARAMDGERVGEAHPAFIPIISQLAPDEAVFLQQIGIRREVVIAKVHNNISAVPPELFEAVFADLRTSERLAKTAASSVFPLHKLNQPNFFETFLEHLITLGLIRYTNEPIKLKDIQMFTTSITGIRRHFIELTGMGQLFFTACIESTLRENSTFVDG